MKKIYVAFDGDEDIQYFNTLKMWKENERIDFNFSNPHDLNSARDDSAVESIKTQLRKRFDVSNVFMILIGQNTKRLTKFVKWEIETALKRNMKIIVVNLNDKKNIAILYNLKSTHLRVL